VSSMHDYCVASIRFLSAGAPVLASVTGTRVRPSTPMASSELPEQWLPPTAPRPLPPLPDLTVHHLAPFVATAASLLENAAVQQEAVDAIQAQLPRSWVAGEALVGQTAGWLGDLLAAYSGRDLALATGALGLMEAAACRALEPLPAYCFVALERVLAAHPANPTVVAAVVRCLQHQRFIIPGAVSPVPTAVPTPVTPLSVACRCPPQP
jgi:hypothetical protein